MRTPDGIKLLADYVQGLAGYEASEPPEADIRRAATIWNHYGQKNFPGIYEEMTLAVADGRVTEVFIRLMELFEETLPELTSAAGIRWIQDHITALANEEVRDGDA